MFEPEHPLAWIPDQQETANEELKDKKDASLSSSIEDSSPEDLLEEDQPTKTPKLSQRKLRDKATLKPPR